MATKCIVIGEKVKAKKEPKRIELVNLLGVSCESVNKCINHPERYEFLELIVASTQGEL